MPIKFAVANVDGLCHGITIRFMWRMACGGDLIHYDFYENLNFFQFECIPSTLVITRNCQKQKSIEAIRRENIHNFGVCVCVWKILCALRGD